MNRQTTWVLMVVAFFLAVVVVVSDWKRTPRQNGTVSKRPVILNVKSSDIQIVSVKRDYWNSFTVRKTPDGSWKLVDPVDEPALVTAINQLLGTLESLPVITTIDLPMNDSERYKEYGLWQPREQITLSTGDKEYTVLLGADTKDGKGIYCAILGQDNVYVTAQDAFKRLAVEMESYRISTATVAPTAKAQ